MRTIFAFLILFRLSCAAAQDQLIKIGLLVVDKYMSDQIGYSTSGGAIREAIDRINDEGLLDNYNFTFVVKDTECDSANTVGSAIEMMVTDNVDFIVGPPCGTVATNVGILSTAYRVPVFFWGYTFNSEFTDATRFPYVANIMTTSISLAYAFVSVCELYDWHNVAVLYVDDASQYCTNIVNDLETAINDPNIGYDLQIAYKSGLNESENTTYVSRMTKAKNTARIFAVCMASGTNKRNFFIYANQLGMVSNDYVYVMLELRSIGFVSSGLSPFWIDPIYNNSDGMNDVVRDAARRIIMMDVARPSGVDITAFNTQVLQDIVDWPLYCRWNSCLAINNNSYASLFSRSLHDAFYLLGATINKTVDSDPQDGYRNRDLFMNMLPGTFNGFTGQVVISENGSREPIYLVSMMNTTYGFNSFLNISVDQNNVPTVVYTIPSIPVVWDSYGGIIPKDTPICGFTGTSCPLGFWLSSGIFVIVAAALVVFLIICAIAISVYLWRVRLLEKERLHSEWQIPHHMLEKPKTSKESKSMRSLKSNAVSSSSQSTKFTYDSGRQETTTTAYYVYNKEPVVASKHSSVFRFDSHQQEEFRKMRKFDHPNVNKFIGISMDGPNTLCVWRMCSRGSLETIIERGTMQLDSFFVFSLIRDITHGLSFLHESFLGFHGNLSSGTCLVDERWQVKLSDFGLRMIRSSERVPRKKQLWIAPEALRNDNKVEHSSADIYSFGIIAAEILSRRPAWDMENRRENIDELIYVIKKGGANPPRPAMLVAEGVEVNAALLHLIRDCWAEQPEDRPNIETVKSLMRSMIGGKQVNLMDHVFKMMEQYTGTLEEEIEERTKELTEEKKTSDNLLYRMLPKQVADRLKLGQSVEPETFESVTIFFSDVVKFTQLSQKCSPIQIVNLLNDLYTSFDTLIEKHGVYKVETIGDGYLCVSGLPHRNGNEHVRLIAELSLDFMETAKAHRIPHLPNERMSLRIGFNTGQCVAGVVGLAMPRYCLFGDTVNTGSRMESNSKAGMIHMSSESNRLLALIGGYVTQSRGDVIIKGKGVLETFWLLGRTTDNVRKAQTPDLEATKPKKAIMNIDEDKISREDFSAGSLTNHFIGNLPSNMSIDMEKGMHDEFRKNSTERIS